MLRRNKTYLLPLTPYLFLFKKRGQVMVEFTFCMVVLFLMMYAVVMVFRWVGLDLGQRQKAHETALTAPVTPLEQIDPYFYTPEPMNAVWMGN